MTWGGIGAMLAVLVAIFIIGHAWFAIVEGVLGMLKRLGRRKQSAWHPLPPEVEKGENNHD